MKLSNFHEHCHQFISKESKRQAAETFQEYIDRFVFVFCFSDFLFKHLSNLWLYQYVYSKFVVYDKISSSKNSENVEWIKKLTELLWFCEVFSYFHFIFHSVNANVCEIIMAYANVTL